jgi:hypothetical protein
VQARLSALFTVASVGVALMGCNHHKAPAAPEPPAVLVTSVVQRDVPLSGLGRATERSVNAQISPKVSGYITKRNYQEGYFVTKGQSYSRSTRVRCELLWIRQKRPWRVRWLVLISAATHRALRLLRQENPVWTIEQSSAAAPRCWP